jgi:hypothetical protein
MNSEVHNILVSEEDAVAALGALIVVDETKKRLTNSLKKYTKNAGIIENEHMQYGPAASSYTEYDMTKVIDILTDDEKIAALNLTNTNFKKLSSDTKERLEKEAKVETWKTRTALTKKK